MWPTFSGLSQRRHMAEVFAKFPCKVLWQLSPKEVPNVAAVADMHMGNNTKVPTHSPVGITPSTLLCCTTLLAHLHSPLY